MGVWCIALSRDPTFTTVVARIVGVHERAHDPNSKQFPLTFWYAGALTLAADTYFLDACQSSKQHTGRQCQCEIAFRRRTGIDCGDQRRDPGCRVGVGWCLSSNLGCCLCGRVRRAMVVATPGVRPRTEPSNGSISAHAESGRCDPLPPSG